MSAAQPPIQQDKYAVILVNLGTPEHYDTKSVRLYLREFLMDPRVIDYPRWLWRIILNFAILPIRSPKVAKLYEQIWLPEGSPLRVYTNQLAKRFKDKLQHQTDADIPVEVAMTYGADNIDKAVNKLVGQGIGRIVVLPLYPQYSATTTAAIFDALNKTLSKVRNLPETRFIKSYAHQDSYIEVLADSIRQHRKNSKVGSQLLLFSFHGLPKRYVDLGDPYQKECEDCALKVAEALGLKDDEWFVSYQSRVGKEVWVKPYTDETLEHLPGKGIKNIDVVCPAFATDCLETLEEIAMENKETFMKAGGGSYEYIPALNDSDEHAGVLAAFAAQHIKNWI